MIHPALDDTRRALLAETRRLLGALEGWQLATGAGPELAQALADAQAQLDDGFLLVVVGEFNAGKSAFIKAALRETLVAALRGSFERERARAAGRVREALEPYESFVRGERERLRDADAGLARLDRDLAALSERTAAFGPDDAAH